MNDNTRMLMEGMAAKTQVIDSLNNVSTKLVSATELVVDLKKTRLRLISNGRGTVPLTDMAKVLGISRQRIYQLLDEDKGNNSK
tara:strand:+ start:257 stop:508 length:252 start_codon:yes stop_codon:yes gene_type:complete